MRRNQPEKIIQQQIVTLLRSIGAQVYVLGTRRPRGDHPGTCQTPGVPDLYAFLPTPRVDVRCGPISDGPVAVWVEVKTPHGRLRPEQETFRQHCWQAGVMYVTGGLDQVIFVLVHGGWLKGQNLPHYRWPQVAAPKEA